MNNKLVLNIDKLHIIKFEEKRMIYYLCKN